MFVVTVLSFDNERTSKVFGAISDARRRASADALNEFDGDVAGITIHQAVVDNPRRAIAWAPVALADVIGGALLGRLAYPCDKKFPHNRQYDWAKKKSDKAVGKSATDDTDQNHQHRSFQSPTHNERPQDIIE